MNIKRIFFWIVFLLVITLIIWGLAVAMNKTGPGTDLGKPMAIGPSDHVFGEIGAPVTLVEYSDFQCPACETYYYFVKKLLDEESSKITFVYRHFPLDGRLPDGTIQHPNALPAAMAAEAAGAQGKFWDMYDLIFSNHTDWTELKDPTDVFVGYASRLGLDATQFKTDLASTTLKDHVNADKDDGIRIGINATPTFFLNGKAIVNPANYEQFKAIIDAAVAGN